MSIMSLLLGTTSTSAYGPTPTIDGTAATGASSATSSVSTNTTTLTTSKTNNIIVVIVCIEGTAVISSSISNVTATGLTFTRYTTNFFASTTMAGYYVLQEVWYATASSTLSAVSVLATTGTYDDATIVAFAVNGCNLSAPFDTGTNMPINTTFAYTSTTKTVTGINTNSNNPLLIASWFTAVSNALNTLDTGYSQIAYVQNSGASKWMFNFVEYKGVSGTAQSSATHSGATTSSTDVWGCTVFAMTG